MSPPSKSACDTAQASSLWKILSWIVVSVKTMLSIVNVSLIRGIREGVAGDFGGARAIGKLVSVHLPELQAGVPGPSSE